MRHDKLLKLGLAKLSSGLVSLALVSAVHAAEDLPDQATAAAELTETIEALNALDEWFSEAERKRNIWLVELERQDRDISRLNKEVGAIVTALGETNDKLDDLAGEISVTETQKKAQAERIATHIAAAYRLTGQDFLKQLLNQESPDTLDRMMRYHRYFSSSRLEVMAEYRATLAQLTELNTELSAVKDEQTEQRQDLEAQQNDLNSERAARAQNISELDQEKETREEEYQRLAANRSRLESLLAELRRRTTELNGDDFKAAKGSLPMPVNPASVRHAFGSPRADNRLRWHGIDIRAPLGTPVTAVYRGRVIFSDWLRGFGLLTIVDHGSDYMTLYGHVDVLLKNVGDWVESGEPIASAGNSGGAQQTGLYFEIRQKGQPLDPITWIDR